MFFCCLTEKDDAIKISNGEVKSFNIPVIGSWKYAGACASPKGTLMYSYVPNGEVKAVLGMDASSKGMWWYPA